MLRLRWHRLGLVLLLVMMISLLGGVVHAQDEVTTVDVFRLDKTFVIIKITFPYEISGNFAGTLAGKHFDCMTIPPSTLICIGRFRVGSDPSFLTIYDQDTEEILLQRVINSPPGNGKGEPDAPPPPPPPSEGDDCSQCDDV